MAWACLNCTQRNAAWATTCGRCDKPAGEVALRRPTRGEAERAKEVARIQGWLREDGTWLWDDEAETA